MILRFVSGFFTRFAKTFGIIFIVAGFGTAAYFYNKAAPMLESVRYRPSALLPNHLSELNAEYGKAKEIVLKFRGQTQFPQQYAAANIEPQFRQTYTSSGDFAELRRNLAVVDSGRSAMKQYITETADSFITDIQRELFAHAQALRAEETSRATPTPLPPPTASTVLPTPSALILFPSTINGEERKETLERVKDYLGTLDESAENPENKKKLQASMAEIALLETLIPEPVIPTSAPPPPTPTPTPENVEPSEPLPAAKVAAHLTQLKDDIKGAVLSEWSLDQAYDNAVVAADDEERNFHTAEFLTRRITGELYLPMAAAIAGGLALGLIFFLIADWTKKSGTEIVDYWSELIENLNVSPKEVYENVEKAVKVWEVPGLEASREFWHEGGAMSAKREYLLFARERLVFEICAAPFGTGSFLSFRLSIVPLVIDPLGIFAVLVAIAILFALLVAIFGLIWGAIVLVLGFSIVVFALRAVIARGLGDLDHAFMKLPIFGSLYELFLRPTTYYRIDTMEMYSRAVRKAVSDSLNSMFGEKGMTLMPNVVSKPVLDRIQRR